MLADFYTACYRFFTVGRAADGTPRSVTRGHDAASAKDVMCQSFGSMFGRGRETKAQGKPGPPSPWGVTYMS